MARIENTTDDSIKKRNAEFISTIFWAGFIIYILSYTISTTGKVNFKICNVFQIIGLGLIIPSAFNTLRYKITNDYLRSIFFLYLLWSVSLVVRGFKFDYEFYKQLLFDTDAGVFLYLVPVMIFYPIKSGYIKNIFNVILVFCFGYLLYDILFIQQLLNPSNDSRSREIIENFTLHLALPVGFMLLTFIYHDGKKNMIALFTLILSFILVVIRARRGLMFMTFSILIFSYLIYQYVNKTKIINIIMSIFLIIILTYIAVSIYQSNREETFSLITERFGQHTRNIVEEYFYRDLKPVDWITGKGIDGTYFCPGVEEDVGKISIYRRVIETGYLQVILNGGLISWLLFLLMAIPAIFKGLFRSSNILSKASGIWIFLFLLFMYPGTMTFFSLYYMLVWISIGICFSNEIRNMTDDEVKHLIFN